MTDAHESRMLIDGRLVHAAGGRTFANVNPATEQEIGQVADASASDADHAITAARRAFDETDWSVNREFRAHCLRQLEAAIASELEEYRQEIIDEVGAPRRLTKATQLEASFHEGLLWPADFIGKFEWERDLGVAEFLGRKSRRVVRKEAVGVVGAIAPWNFPMETSISKLGPALATGNTVILKPAPDTPFNATRLGRLIRDKTDIPAGVVNVLTSSDHMIGEALVTDPRVNLISFTGSTATGRRIMEKGAPTLKRLFLELGGKSANIILDDADLNVYIPGAIAGLCSHAGQGCVIATRLLVPRAQYAEVIDRAVAALEAVPYGDPNDPDVIMGPVISARQRDRVLGYIDIGVSEGARLVAGGHRAPQFDRGYFVEPTLFADVENSMRIAREEIFGPVLCVIPYSDDDDAVRIANDSEYGLGGAIASGDLDRAIAVAERVRTGVLRINGNDWYGPASPFGGYKQSGVGRQNGVEGFEQYLETKTMGLPA
jgi:aldehyde dehydrogenase (NAD+)